MGIFSDFLASAKSIDNDGEVTALDHVIQREIDAEIAKGDAAYPTASYEGEDEVQTLSASGATAGTFDITVGINTPNGDIQVAVASIDFDETPANIQTALDAAVGAAFADYTAGDITVSGAGTADLNDTIFTYDGDSVANLQHPLSTVDGGSLTGGGSEAFAETNGGQTGRSPWAIMELYSLAGFTSLPTQGGSLPTLTKVIDRGNTPFSDAFLRALALEAEIQDEIPGLESVILTAMGLKAHPPASSQG
jgi:hypothetical protein